VAIVPAYAVKTEAYITLTKYNQVYAERTVIVPDANSFYSELKFGKYIVEDGESFNACVHIIPELNRFALGYNNEKKAPEEVSIWLTGGNYGGGSSSSNSSSSSSSSSSSRICILATCPLS
jgi:hypothetical protein